MPPVQDSNNTTGSSNSDTQNPEDVLYEEVINEDASMQQHKWNHKTILLLIRLYKENCSNRLYARPRKLWLAVAEEFRKAGYVISDEECSRKWSNLKITHKRIQDNNKDSKKRVIKWPYYQPVDDILKAPCVEIVPPQTDMLDAFHDPSFVSFLLNSVKKNKTRVVIPSSEDNDVQTTSDATVNLVEEEEAAEINDSNVQEAENGEASQATEIVAKEMSNGSIDATAITTLEADPNLTQDDGSAELFEHRFVWNYPAVADLLGLVRAKQDKFANPMIKRKNIWREIGKAMFEKGYPVTSQYCEKKWRNLRGTYKAILYKCQKNPNAKKNWEYYNDLHEICKDDPSLHSFSGGSSLDDSGSQPTTIRVVSAGGATYHIIEQPRSILTPTRRSNKTTAMPRIDAVTSLNSTAKLLAAASTSSAHSNLHLQSASGLKRKLAPTPCESEPQWFLAFKKEIRDTNERTLKELRTMHDENLRVLKQRNQIIKSLVLTLIAQNKADMDAEEADLLDEVTKALSTQVT